MKPELADYPRIMFAKVAWAREYRGAPDDRLIARHAYVQEHDDGHERFNFMPGPDGRVYGYLVPQRNAAPAPSNPNGWLIIFVARLNGEGDFVPVGWYKNARIRDGYRHRPEYPNFPLDVTGERYSYVVEVDSAADAYCIPAPRRSKVRVPSVPRFVNARFLYARGHGQSHTWREEYASVAGQILDTFAEPSTAGVPADSTYPVADLEVAEAAIQAVFALLHRDPLVRHVADRQLENCGYDLLAHLRNGDEWHIEVKGTRSPRARFFMSRNEYAYRNDPRWRLAMVTSAVDGPVVELLTLQQVEQKFRIQPFTWEGVA